MAFIQDSRFYQWSTHIEKMDTSKIKISFKINTSKIKISFKINTSKINGKFFRIDNWITSKTNCNFSQNWQLNQHLSQKIAQFVQRIYTTCIIDFTRKMTLLPKISLNKIFWIKISIFQQNYHIQFNIS